MIVKLDAESGQVQLDNADDFRRFHVLAPDGFDTGSVTGIEDAADDHVWVAIDALKVWAGERPVEWTTDFDKMVAGARKYGFVSDDGTAIKAHVERQTMQ